VLVVRASLDLANANPGGSATDLTARALNPASVFEMLFLVAAALWLTAQHRSGEMVPASPLRRALHVFVIAGLLGLVGTSSRGVSTAALGRILGAVMMFVVLERMMREPTTMHAILRARLSVRRLPLAFTLMGVISGPPRSEVNGDFAPLLGPFNHSYPLSGSANVRDRDSFVSGRACAATPWTSGLHQRAAGSTRDWGKGSVS
jgi:hypothetical protein